MAGMRFWEGVLATGMLLSLIYQIPTCLVGPSNKITLQPAGTLANGLGRHLQWWCIVLIIRPRLAWRPGGAAWIQMEVNIEPSLMLSQVDLMTFQTGAPSETATSLYYGTAVYEEYGAETAPYPTILHVGYGSRCTTCPSIHAGKRHA